ncbi:hypothetical protein [Mangrovimonas xylaniphaga]|uniref:hypothetical protein n=1 Tax=Mangrovimonas xylaniphaga TaxID=1645915 RepID=UPI0006B69BBE|nr:hypothetical protein [Mangrovimonas xylaniphaga]
MRNLFPLVAPVVIFLTPIDVLSQKRIQQPSNSGIESADKFVAKSFEIYENVFVHDSLTQAGAEVPDELEDAILEQSQQNIDSLWEIFPEVVDDIANGNGSFMKKSRATLNMSKVKKTFRYCGEYLKGILVGTTEEER